MANSYTFLFEVSPIKRDGSIKTLHMSSTGSSSKTVYLDGKQWLPLIETPPDFEFRLMSNGELQYASVSYGDLEFIVSDIYANENWSSYDWTNAQGRCWYGLDGAPFEDFKQVFEGKVSGWRRSDIYAKVALLGTEADLQVPALYQEYDGIGGREGGEGVKGQLKPRAHGYGINITPKLFDSVYWVYQVHGYGAVQSIPMVYEFGQSLAPSVGDVSTYEQLIGLALQPGQWATCLAEGMFRMGGEPSQILTCDVLGGKQNGVYASTAKQIIQQLIKEVKPSAQFGTFPACFDAAWSTFDVDPVNIWDIVYRAAFEVGGYIYPDGSGVWQAGDFYSPVQRGQLRSDRTTEPLVLSYEEDTSTGPIWKVSVGYDRVWTVHKTNEISPAIFDAAEFATDEDLIAAKARFEAAVSDVTIQQARLAKMASDGILTRAEKLYWSAKFDKETNDKNQMVEDGSPYDVAALIATYEAKYAALSSYLNSLAPSWTDTGQDTAVVYSTWSSRWNALWDAKVALATAMIGVAEWNKVVGTGKPEDNATVGAPAGTNVAGVPAEQLVDQINSFTGVNIYPWIERQSEMAALVVTGNAANDIANQGYRDEVFEKVDTLRHDILADGESYAEAINSLTTTQGNLQTQITEQANLRSSGDAANASAIQIVATKADQNAAAILTEKNARTTALSAVATVLEELQAQVDDTNAAITTEKAVTTSKIAAETTARNQQVSSLDASLRAVIISEQNTRAAKDVVLTTSIDQLNAQVADAHARITTEKNASVARDGANASTIQAVQTSLDGTNSSLALVKQTATATSTRLGVVEGKYVLSVQGGADVAGMAIAAGGGTSKIVFQADAIAFRNPSNGAADDLMEYANGELRVKAARIGTATIQNGHIVNFAVGTDKMAYNAATVPVSSFSAAITGLANGVWTNIQTASIVSSGAPIFISASHCMEIETGDRDVDYRILRNGVEIYNVADISFSAGFAGGDWMPHTFNCNDTPPPGAYTYQFQGKTNDGASSKNRSLFLLETKR